MTEQETKERALADYDTARKRLSTIGTKASKGAGGLEREYSMAYQRLVMLGLAVQIRRKYR